LCINLIIMGIEDIIAAPRSPWQNPYVERLIGSIRRECLDHIIIFNQRHLRGVLSRYFQYHHRTRTHLSLDKDCPQPRRIQPPSAGEIIAFPEVGRSASSLRTSGRMTSEVRQTTRPLRREGSLHFLTVVLTGNGAQEFSFISHRS
jgi:hypothetical protein